MEAQMRETLDHLPPMDDMKIGPGGQTFGQLKADVVSLRGQYMECLMSGEVPVVTQHRYDSAVKLLKAAYTRVGLPYVAP